MADTYRFDADSDGNLGLKDILQIFRRRFRVFLLTFIVVLVAAFLVIQSLPARYTSSAVILVESQQIPDELIRAAVTSAAYERIRVIEQRVMTRQNLVDVIDKFGLYSKDRDNVSLTELVDRLRNSIDTEIIEVGKSRRRRDETAVSFSISHTGVDPRLVSQVANQIVTLFLEENVRSRTSRASETTEFLTSEAASLDTQLKDLERQIADFKLANSGALPEHLNLRFSILERKKAEYNQRLEQVRAAQDQLRLFDVEIGARRRNVSVEGDAALVPSSTALIVQQLQERLADLRLTYHDTHPEIQQLIDRIEALDARDGEDKQRKELATQIANAEVERDQLITRMSLDDPRVKAVDARLADLNQQLRDLPRPGGSFESTNGMELEIARLEAQRTAAAQRLADAASKREELEAEIVDLEQRIVLTPQIESELTSLQRQYEHVREQFDAISRKRNEAQLSENLEESQKAERFILLEPPRVPEVPTSPNREKLRLVAVVLSLGMASVLAFSRDILSGAVFSVKQVRATFTDQLIVPLASIKTEADEAVMRRQIWIALMAMPLLALTGGLMVHFFYMPVDLVFFKILAKM